MLKMLFLIKNAEASKKGSPIYCRVTINKTKVDISTGVKIPSDWWNVDAKKVIPNSKVSSKDKILVKEYNDTLYQLERKIRMAYNRLADMYENITAKQVKGEMLGTDKHKTINEVLDLMLNKAQSEGKNEVVIKVKRFKEAFSSFSKRTYASENMLVRDMEKHHDLSMKFESWASETRGWKSTYIKKMFSYYIRAVKIAHSLGWMSRIPNIGNITVNQKDIIRKDVLILDEIHKIRDTDFQNQSLRRIADIFLFQCFTGLAYVDVKNLKWEDLQKDSKENVYVAKKRQKSAQDFVIPVNEQAIEIIEKYRTDQHRRAHHPDSILPVKSNAKMNTYLKVIADLCGIDKKLSTHVARYTYNQLLYEAGVSNEIRKQILGHSTVSMTAHYTSAKSEVISEEVKKLKF
jgi:integrase